MATAPLRSGLAETSWAAAVVHRPALVHQAGEEGACLVVGDSLLVVDTISAFFGENLK